MKLADALVLVDEVLDSEARASLRSPAKRVEVTATSKALGVALPASLKALYEWHDGEHSTSMLFDETLHEEFDAQWSAFDEGPFEVRFMRLEDVKRAGTTTIWLDADGQASRTKPDEGSSEETVVVPFVWIRSAKDDEDEAGPREISDNDWFLAVDASREAVWLFEQADEGLEGIFEDSADLAAWLEGFATKAKLVQSEINEGPSVTSAPQEPAVLLMRFMLDRKLVELAEGATIDHVARKLAPLLALVPPKRAVRAVLDRLAEDDAIDEVFADDDLLAKVVVEFVA